MVRYGSKIISGLFLLFLSTTFSLLFPQRWTIELLSPFICPGAVYFQQTEQPLIALTIDDSPDTKTTRQILNVLAQYNVVATFFPVSDELAKNNTIAKAFVREGHEIGNHLTEDRPSIQLKENFASELKKAHRILSKYTTTNIRWLRPGGGWCNKEMINTSRKYDYQVVLGSVWSYDTHIPSADFAAWFILANTKPGSIIVLHDVGQRGTRTVTTLQKVIPKLKQKGYRFVTLTELFDNSDLD